MFLAVLTMPVFAGVADDAIRLAGSGVSDDVVIAWAEQQHGASVNAVDILKMKEGKVPEKVILELIHAATLAQTAMQSIPPTDRYVSTPAPVAQPAEQPIVQYAPPVVQTPAPMVEPVYVAPATTYVVSTPYYGYPYAPYYGGVAVNFGFFGGHYGHWGHR